MSEIFGYYAPTKVVFGKGAELQVAELIREQGCKKVLLHYGSQSAKRTGLLDRIEKCLTDGYLNKAKSLYLTLPEGYTHNDASAGERIELLKFI